MDIYAPRTDATELLEAAETAYLQHAQTVQEDPEYPKLHLAPPVGRLNDPNGLLYDNGVYHAFYQYSPLHPTRAVFWRHATSTDLTRWEDDQTAIAPVTWYDKSGCYSGSGFIAPDGTYEFFYTGNIKDDNDVRSVYQAMFVSKDQGRTFERLESNPLIADQPAGYTAHFRDPHLVERHGAYAAVLGAQREDLTGAIALYTSEDRRNWNFEGEIEFSDPALHAMGYMLECPILFSMVDEATGEEKDVMMFCPQGMEAEGEKYNNIYQCGYVVGKLTGTSFAVEQAFTEIDAGFEFYAPQTVHKAEDTHGAPVLMAWMGNAEQDDQPSWDKNWVHMLTYPRELSLRGGKIYQRPVSQLERVLPLEPVTVGADGVIAQLGGRRQFRLAGTANLSQGDVRIVLTDGASDAVILTLTQDCAVLDRSGTRYQVGGATRHRTLPLSDTKDFEMLFDGSAVEVFVDGGREVFTSRVFLHEEPGELRVRATAQGVLSNVSVGVMDR
ncbi:glycoside hydrolase family 32 protein [Rothia sp. ZJ1223]|uniref:glycoside hydrolase family 32 protein n=1 Tax=Rothia sp. ZJ1223 TaxID=2811098 RepID=UPI00195927FF|nr:glycoside hydrolase family 32 protein [Rothia sp. ZJ1223]